jgi:hypothetical protein
MTITSTRSFFTSKVSATRHYALTANYRPKLRLKTCDAPEANRGEIAVDLRAAS